MKFGVNEEVNKVTLPLGGNSAKTAWLQGVPESGTLPATPSTQRGGDSPPPSVIPEVDETAYLLGTAVTLGFVVARYVI